MRILCSISGIEFSVDHFPGEFFSREVYHPVFHLPQKRLLSYTHKWASGELTRTDSYLLFLALLNSSNQLEFRVPVFRNELTDALIANNMEYLVRTVIKLNSVLNPAVTFPRFAVTIDTRYLTNVYHWIDAWDEAYKEFQSGYKSAHESAKLINREAALSRMIKNPHRATSDYAGPLAEWAVVAGQFPEFLMSPVASSPPIRLCDYWKAIIQKCARDESLYTVREADLAELIEHCEDKIPVGSIFSHALFKLLRHAEEKHKNFLGFSDRDLVSNYSILSESSDVESANLKALIDSAPLEQPRREQYASQFQFIRAKLRWDMARKAGER